MQGYAVYILSLNKTLHGLLPDYPDYSQLPTESLEQLRRNPTLWNITGNLSYTKPHFTFYKKGECRERERVEKTTLDLGGGGIS